MPEHDESPHGLIRRPEAVTAGTSLNRAVLGIILLFVAYCVTFIFNSSFVVNGQRWFCLFDDAMVSMRYARNFANGYGLTWNPGERVEGFTNPAWTFLMAGVHLLESKPNIVALYIQVISVGLLVCTLLATARLGLVLGSSSPIAALAAVAGVAFYFPLNYFSLMGMETGALAFLITLATVLFAKSQKDKRSDWKPWLCLGLATIVRLDAVVPLAAATVALLLHHNISKKQVLTRATLVFCFCVGGQTLLRWWYYHEVLPNTWFLKMTGIPFGLRLGRGAWVTSRFLVNHLWPIYLIVPFALLHHFRHREGSMRRLRTFAQSNLVLPCLIVLGQVFYSIYVGGDVWEREFYGNRFLVIVMPLIFLILCQAILAAISHFNTFRRETEMHPIACASVLGVLLIFQSNWHGGYTWARQQMVFKVPLKDVEDARALVELSLLLNSIAPDGSTFATERAGILPYFMTSFHFYDTLGKTDPVIARMNAAYIPTGIDDFVPGHLKWNASHTLHGCKPDMLIAVLGIMHTNYQPWLEAEYERVKIPGVVTETFVRKTSGELSKTLVSHLSNDS